MAGIYICLAAFVHGDLRAKDVSSNNKWIFATNYEEILMNLKYAGLAAIAASAISPSVFAGDLKMPEVSYSGYIRVDGTYKSEEDASGDESSSSNLKASKVALTLDAEASEQVSGSVTFEWAGGGDGVEVDEAIIVVKPKDTGLEFTLGKHVIPFGALNSSFMTDSQGIVLAETNEHAITAKYTTGMATIQGSIYNGEAKDGDDIDGFLARLDLQINDDLSVGASINSNMANSDTLAEEITGISADGLDDAISGLTANISYGFAKFQFDAEYITALEEFDAADLGFAGGGEYEPQIFTFEAKYDLGGDSHIAGRIEVGDDGAGLIAENTFGVIYKTPVLDYLTFEAEFQRAEYETDDEYNQVKLRLKYKF